MEYKINTQLKTIEFQSNISILDFKSIIDKLIETKIITEEWIIVQGISFNYTYPKLIGNPNSTPIQPYYQTLSTNVCQGDCDDCDCNK